MLYLPASTKTYVFIGVDGPAAFDPAAGTISGDPCIPWIAVIADDGTEPATADWKRATWIDGQAALLVGTGGDATYTPGFYMAWVALEAGTERPVLPAGRIRIGDLRA